MSEFNYTRWMQQNKVGPYGKILSENGQEEFKEWEEGDEDSNDPDYVQDEKEQEYHRAEEEARKTPTFKRGDVLKTKQQGNEALTVIVLKAYPDLETALEDRPQDAERLKSAADDIIDGEGAPVSKDIADKPWYLTWAEDPGTIGEGSDLIFLDPQELLYK